MPKIFIHIEDPGALNLLEGVLENLKKAGIVYERLTKGGPSDAEKILEERLNKEGSTYNEREMLRKAKLLFNPEFQREFRKNIDYRKAATEAAARARALAVMESAARARIAKTHRKSLH